MAKPLRLLYAAGPGNVIGTYQHWREGRDDPSQVSVTYSGQFYDVCRDLDAQACVIASCPTPGRLRDGRFTFEHRPVPFEDGPGAFYHLGQVWYALRLIVSAVLFRAEAVVVTNGSGHWFPLAALPHLGIQVIPSLHCVLWPKGRPPGGLSRIVLRLSGPFFARAAYGILSASQDIGRQLAALTWGKCRSVTEFLPTYRPETFAGTASPECSKRPFRVFFAGRVERNKGVFDLLKMARRFATAGRSDIEFDLCGDGSALAELRRQADHEGLAKHFRCHGYSSRAVMREMFAQAHAVIVPTTTDFIEGFNQVVAEGVLAGRPVITSSVCPALEYVRDAVVEVPPDDVPGYGNAILQLCDDVEFYQARCRGCVAAQAQFYDVKRGWGAALASILRRIGHDHFAFHERHHHP